MDIAGIPLKLILNRSLSLQFSKGAYSRPVAAHRAFKPTEIRHIIHLIFVPSGSLIEALERTSECFSSVLYCG